MANKRIGYTTNPDAEASKPKRVGYGSYSEEEAARVQKENAKALFSAAKALGIPTGPIYKSPYQPGASNIGPQMETMDEQIKRLQTEIPKKIEENEREYQALLNYDDTQDQRKIEYIQAELDNHAKMNKMAADIQYDESQLEKMSKDDPLYKFTKSALQKKKYEYRQLLEKYNDYDYETAKEEILNIKNNIAYKKRYQELFEMNESATADPDFEKYVKIGEKLVDKDSSTYEYMEEDERKLFAYYTGKDQSTKGGKYAEKYEDLMEETLNQREGQEFYNEYLKGNEVLEWLYGGYAALDSLGSSVAAIFNTEGEYVPATWVQYAGQFAYEDLSTVGPKLPDWLGGGSLGQAAYNVINTTVRMVPAILVTKVVGIVNPIAGKVVGSTLLGASSGGNAYQQAINNGWDKSQARTYGVLVGVSETVLSAILSKAFGGKALSAKVTTAIEAVENGLARFALNYGVAFGGEGIEEGLQEFLTPIFENIALGYDKNGFEDIDWGEVAYSTLLGGFSGGNFEFLGSAARGVKHISSVFSIKKEYNTPEKTKNLLKLALSFPADSKVNKLATEYNNKVKENGKLSINKVYNLVMATENALTERLTSLGEKGNVSAVASAALKAVTTRELSQKEIALLANSKYGAEVLKSVSVTEEAETPELQSNANGENTQNSTLQEGENVDNSALQSSAEAVQPTESEQTDGKYRVKVKKASGNVTTFGGIDTDTSKHLDKAQQDEIKGIGNKLGREVIFEDFHKLKKFKNKEKVPDGYIDKDGKVHINFYAKKPVQFLLKHEITHYLKRKIDKFKYADFQNLVFGSEAFKTWMQSKGFASLTELKQDVYNRYSEVKNFNEQDAFEEILADFVGDYLFGGENAVSQKLIDALAPKQKKTFMEIIKDIIAHIKQKFSGNEKIQGEIAKLEDRFVELYNEAAKVDKGKSSSEGVQYSYAGKKSKTHNLSLLEKAIKMDDIGKATSEEIRQETGWFKGYDGEWRYEISDRDMEINLKGNSKNPDIIRYNELTDKFLYTPENFTSEDSAELNSLKKSLDGVRKKPSTLGEILKHDKLFAAYPQLKEVLFGFDDFSDNTKGEYDYIKNKITLDNSLFNDMNEMRKVLIHEIQHAIQGIEGFATGSNIEYWQNQRKNIIETLSGARANLDLWLDEIGYFEFAKNSMQQVVNREKTLEQHWKDCQEFKANSKYAEQIAKSEKEIAEYERQYKEITNGMTPSEQYSNTAGEIEARDAANRWWRSDEARRELRPDIDRENVVFARKNNISQEIRTSDSGEKYVYIEPDSIDLGNGVSIAKKLATLFREKFNNLILVNGQYFRINSKTNKEFTGSDWALALKKEHPDWFDDKIQTLAYADEILKTAKDWINQKPKHPRNDKITSFGHGEILYKVGEQGYSAEVIVGLKDDGSAILYDIIKIDDKKIVDTRSVGKGKSLSSTDVSTTSSISKTNPTVKNNISEEGEDYSIPATSNPEELLEAYENGDISRQEYLDAIKKKKTLNPKEITDLTKEDANTTPKLKKKEGVSTGNKTSKFYGSVLASSIFDPKFKAEVATDTFVEKYKSVTNKETLRKAAKELDEGGQSYVDEWKDKKPEHASLIDTAVGFILMDRYQRIGDYESAAKATEKVREFGTAGGQQVQIFSIIGRLTPSAMAAYAQLQLDKAFEIFKQNKTKEWLEKNKDKYKLTDDEIEFIRLHTLQAALFEEGTRQRAVFLGEIMALLQSKLPPEKGDSIRAWQRISMLLNLRTIQRNVVGNAGMVPIYIASDLFGTAIDKVAAKKTGTRTKGVWMPSSIKGMGKGFYESYDDFKRGIRTRMEDLNRFDVSISKGKNFNENSDGLFGKEILKNQLNAVAKVLNKIDNFTSFCLEAGDRPFFEMWFMNSLNKQMKLNNVDVPTAQMMETAKQEALERTWQDDNVYTRAVGKIKSGLNVIHLPKTNYGLGDVVIKFVKTPTNIAKAIYDFSPVAFANAAVNIRKLNNAIKTDNFTPELQRAVVRSLSNAITGTVIYTLIAVGASLGLVKLTGDDDEDKDVSNYEKYIMGTPPYSIEFFGTSITYDWMQPFGSILAMVAEYNDIVEENPDMGAGSKIWEVIKAGGSTLAKQSFLKSMEELFSGDNIAEGVANAMLADPSAFIPQLSSQVASFFDEYRRTTYDSNSAFQTAINKVIAKIPGLREKLPKQVNSLGEDVKNTQYLDVWDAFMSPWNTYPKSSKEVVKDIYKLYKDSGDNSVMPRMAPNSFTLKGLKINLTPEEKNDIQRAMGDRSVQMLAVLFDSSEYEKLDDKQKVKVVENIYSYAWARAKSELEYDFETLTVFMGENKNGDPILTKEKYDRMSEENIKKMIENIFLSNAEIKRLDDYEKLVEYWIRQAQK